jgi:hypothetical protein
VKILIGKIAQCFYSTKIFKRGYSSNSKIIFFIQLVRVFLFPKDRKK